MHPRIRIVAALTLGLALHASTLQAAEFGPPALKYLTDVVHRRPRAWVYEVEALHPLLQRHGAKARREAFIRALAQETFGTEYLRHYLHEARAELPRGALSQ